MLRDGLVQVVGAHRVGEEVGGLRLGHLDHRAQDDARQPHAADGGPEQGAVRVVLRAFRLQVQDAAVGHEQFHGHDVLAEGAGRVVVLAVDVRADGPADGDLAGAGQDRDPEAEGDGGLHQLIQRHAAVHVDQGGLRVDGVDAVELLHVDDQAAAVLGGVAVGAAHAAGDDAAALMLGEVGVLLGDLRDGLDDAVQVRRGQHVGGGRRGAAPAGQRLFCGVKVHHPILLM